MATVTKVSTVVFVATMLDEDEVMLETIVSNDDHLGDGAIIRGYIRWDEAIIALTGDGVSEPRDMLADGRRTPQRWRDFPKDSVSEPGIIARVGEHGPR